MPRHRRPTDAEMAAVNARQYEYIGGGPPPTVPARKPRRADKPAGPAYVHLLGEDRPDGRTDVVCAFRLLDTATAAAAAARTAGTDAAVTTVPLLDEMPPPGLAATA